MRCIKSLSLNKTTWNFRQRNIALNNPPNIMDLSVGKGIVYDSFPEDVSQKMFGPK